ncbi:MAG: hypothetical protein GT600_14420, partial [Bacteroidales bacterium]|nr:hypothetical protein [Bacteroidales bacterium]
MEIIIYITGGLVAGLLISWIITRYIWNSKVEAKNAEINELNRKNSSLEARVEAQANSIEEVRNAMLNTFKAAASDALVQNNKQFLDLAKTHL